MPLRFPLLPCKESSAEVPGEAFCPWPHIKDLGRKAGAGTRMSTGERASVAMGPEALTATPSGTICPGLAVHQDFGRAPLPVRPAGKASVIATHTGF